MKSRFLLRRAFSIDLAGLCIVVTALLISCLWIGTAKAADRYFVGALDSDSNSPAGSFEHTDNWSTTPCGSTGASVPGTSDVAHFSGTCGNTVTIRSRVNIQGLALGASYTGTLLMGTGSLQIGTSDFLMGSGTFIGSGSGNIRIADAFTMTGGIVNGIQTTMTLSGSLSITEEDSSTAPTTFASTGTIIFDGAADQNFISGNGTDMTLSSVNLQNSGSGTSDDIIVNMSGGLNLSGALTITLGNLDFDTNNQTLAVEGGITIADAAQATLVSDGNITASGSISTGGAGSITLSGSMTLTLNGIDQNLDTNNTSIPSLTINSSSGTTLANSERVTGTLQVNTGSTLTLSTFTMGATGATIINYATMAENTGKIVHTPSSFIITNSSYAESSSITLGNTVYFSLNDGDENLSGTTAETVSITATTVGGDSETITLTETGNFTGIFRGSITSEDTTGGSVTSGNSKLESADNATLTITFTDAQDGIASTDTATLADSASTSTTTTTTTSGGIRSTTTAACSRSCVSRAFRRGSAG